MIVAFDADDTLWHNEDEFQRAHRKFESLLTQWADAETVDRTLYATEMRNLARYGYGVKSFTLSMLETAVEIGGPAVDGTVAARIIEMGHSLLDRPTDLLDDVTDVLDALDTRGIDAMVITKGDLHHQLTKLAVSGIAERFTAVEVVAEKDATTYRGVLATHGIPIDEFVMVGNSLSSDILPVIEIGGRAVHVPYAVTWAHESRHDDAGHEVPTIERLGELPALLDGWHDRDDDGAIAVRRHRRRGKHGTVAENDEDQNGTA